jgi:magnesium chelatase subunit D
VGLDAGRVAARLLRADPRLGGIWLRDADGGPSEALIAEAKQIWDKVRVVPANIDAEALLGGVDIAASLGAGRAVRRPGLIEDATGTLLLVRGAERMPAATGALLAAGIERGSFAMLLLDEGSPEETPPAALIERLAFHLRHTPEEEGTDPSGEDAATTSDDEILDVLAGTAALLGVDSARAMNLALRAARASAALAGRHSMQAGDAALAARLVLAPRATRLPASQEEAAPEPDQAPEPGTRERLEDVVLEAARAALPPDLLERLAEGRRRGPAPRARGAGERRRSPDARPAGRRSIGLAGWRRAAGFARNDPRGGTLAEAARRRRREARSGCCGTICAFGVSRIGRRR